MGSADWAWSAALRPGPSMVAELPQVWTVAPSDNGGWFVLGGHLAGDPDVMLAVELAKGEGRDLGESMAWLVAELLAVLTAGTTCGVTLSEKERAELTSQLCMVLRAGRDG